MAAAAPASPSSEAALVQMKGQLAELNAGVEEQLAALNQILDAQ